MYLFSMDYVGELVVLEHGGYRFGRANVFILHNLLYVKSGIQY